MSATPSNQAAPPPTPGPLSARMKTFLWSIIERSISIARCRLEGISEGRREKYLA